MIVAEATQEFITAMDVLRLDQRAVDEVQPVLSTLVNALNKCETIALGFDKSKLQVCCSLQRYNIPYVLIERIKQWLVTLNGMRASNDLSDDQVRQLLLDLG